MWIPQHGSWCAHSPELMESEWGGGSDSLAALACPLSTFFIVKNGLAYVFQYYSHLNKRSSHVLCCAGGTMMPPVENLVLDSAYLQHLSNYLITVTCLFGV